MSPLMSKLTTIDFPLLCELLHKMRYIDSGDNVLFDNEINLNKIRRRKGRAKDLSYYEFLLEFYYYNFFNH